MKKMFFFAAALMASAVAMAGVDFQYLPTAGDKNAASTEFNKSDKVPVEAGEQLCAGENFTVYNAYKTTYKAVGMLTDTAYAALQIGDVTVDYNTVRIQGQDNPTAGGANPVIEMTCPNAGACFKVDVKKDGWLYVAVKTTPNKQQFVFESVVESNGVVGGTFVGHQYLMMANKENGKMCVEFVGDKDNYNELMAPPAMPYTYFTDKAFSTNGVGVLALQVYAEGSPYIIGTAGSKMMACGFGFSEEAVEVKAIGSKGIKALKPEWTGEDNYDDVVLTNDIKKVELTERPIFIKVAMPANEYHMDNKYTADDTTNIWAKVIVDKAATESTPATYKLSANLYAWTWGTYKDDTEEAGKWLQAAKSGNYYVLQVDGMKVVNVVLNADGDWSDNNHKTVDFTGITSDVCLRVGDVPADKNTPCEIIVLDCLTGEEAQGIENVFEGKKAVKMVENGQLIMVIDGVRYNAIGAQL